MKNSREYNGRTRIKAGGISKRRIESKMRKKKIIKEKKAESTDGWELG